MNFRALLTAFCALILLNVVPFMLLWLFPGKWMGILIFELCFLFVLYTFLLFIKATQQDEEMMAEWILELTMNKQEEQIASQNN